MVVYVFVSVEKLVEDLPFGTDCLDLVHFHGILEAVIEN